MSPKLQKAGYSPHAMVIFFYNIIFINLNISIKPLKKYYLEREIA